MTRFAFVALLAIPLVLSGCQEEERQSVVTKGPTVIENGATMQAPYKNVDLTVKMIQSRGWRCDSVSQAIYHGESEQLMIRCNSGEYAYRFGAVQGEENWKLTRY